MVRRLRRLTQIDCLAQRRKDRSSKLKDRDVKPGMKEEMAAPVESEIFKDFVGKTK